MKFIDVMISKEMIKEAKNSVEKVKVNRTVASPIDTIVGLIGEFAFAEWFYGNWKEHDVYGTKGKEDFFNEIEIKTSVFPFSRNLNLLVREDYASKRKPKFYIQIIIDIERRHQKIIPAGTNAILAGFASHREVDQAPLRDFGSKFGDKGGYRCRYISIRNLQPMSNFNLIYNRPNEV